MVLRRFRRLATFSGLGDERWSMSPISLLVELIEARRSRRGLNVGYDVPHDEGGARQSVTSASDLAGTKNHLFCAVSGDLVLAPPPCREAIFRPSQGCDGRRGMIRGRPVEGTSTMPMDRPRPHGSISPDLPAFPKDEWPGRVPPEGSGHRRETDAGSASPTTILLPRPTAPRGRAGLSRRPGRMTGHSGAGHRAGGSVCLPSSHGGVWPGLRPSR